MATMTDREIVDVYNGILAAQERLLAAWDKTVTEEPPGEKQIDYHDDSGQWVPRGDVLRCIIDDGGREEKSLSISTTRNCHSPNSAGCSRFMRVGVCGSRSCLRNSYPESKGRNPKAQAAKALTATPARCLSPQRDYKFEADALAQTAP